MNALDYPIVVGGKPMFILLGISAFLELTILSAPLARFLACCFESSAAVASSLLKNKRFSS